MANRDLTNEEKIVLEGLVDSADLNAVIMALSEICGEKAEHIRSNYDDRKLARNWDHAAGAIGCVVSMIPKL